VALDEVLLAVQPGPAPVDGEAGPRFEVHCHAGLEVRSLALEGVLGLMLEEDSGHGFADGQDVGLLGRQEHLAERRLAYLRKEKGETLTSHSSINGIFDSLLAIFVVRADRGIP